MTNGTLPDTASIYHTKLTDPDTAMETVTSGSSDRRAATTPALIRRACEAVLPRRG